MTLEYQDFEKHIKGNNHWKAIEVLGRDSVQNPLALRRGGFLKQRWLSSRICIKCSQAIIFPNYLYVYCLCFRCWEISFLNCIWVGFVKVISIWVMAMSLKITGSSNEQFFLSCVIMEEWTETKSICFYGSLSKQLFIF